MDANGVLNVNAVDKAGGKSNKITITNDKGRLSKDDIERMVNEAERFKEEDAKHKKKIDARNGFENYVYSVKSSTSDPGVKDKLSDGDRATIEDACKTALEWLEMSGTDVDTEQYEAEQKKLENIVSPIVSKLYGSQQQQQGQQGQQGQQQQGQQQQEQASSGPNIEEVD
jgi:L1 cell adhesion molecule like protein